MIKKLFFIILIVFILPSFLYGADKTKYFEIKNKRDSLLKIIGSQPVPDPETVNKVIELDKQIKDYKDLIRMFNLLINYRPENKIENSISLAFYYRRTGDYKKSETLLLDVFNKIKGQDNFIDAALLKLVPALLFTFQKTKNKEDSINFFKLFPSHYSKSKNYDAINQFINIMILPQYEYFGQTLRGLKFKTISGKNFDINQLKGKYVLVDFWATWCPPCVQEMPHFVKAYKKYKPNGLEIIGISLDSDINAVNNFIAKYEIIWENYFDGRGWGNTVALVNRIKSIPSVFLLDKNGKILYSNFRSFLLTEILEELFS
ncbi:MAG TPA: TlpA disulfide reductase family protein [bacterium]|nr:TlpA disulfide reductase family protein [bacterium]HPN32446.1 TlpA disulfide reductase family protein [bacterium]